MTRGTRRKEQESLKHTQTPSPPLAHSTKEVGNKKTKEQEDQGHKMTRGNNKKGTIPSGKQEENNKKERNKMTTKRKAGEKMSETAEILNMLNFLVGVFETYRAIFPISSKKLNISTFLLIFSHQSSPSLTLQLWESFLTPIAVMLNFGGGGGEG